jgi:WD40 repeat protein
MAFMLKTILHRCGVSTLYIGAILAPLFSTGPPLNAQGLSSSLLRVCSSMHTGIIGRIASDRSGGYILSCSIDKTAKLWDAQSGELIRTFYPPSGDEREGSLYACALSADARIAAVSGWTGWSATGHCSMYLFNTSSGSLDESIGDLPYPASDIAFSANGVFMAVSFYGSFGARIYRVSGLRLEKALDGFSASCTHCIFDCKGRLAIACSDGRTRVYSQGFDRFKEIPAEGGKIPFSISFSFDGDKLAVGYDNSAAITIYNSSSLAKIQSIPDTNDFPGCFSLVAWSKTSNDLFSVLTGAFSRKNGTSILKRYVYPAKECAEERTFSSDVLMDIKILPDNSIAFTGLKPQLGRIDLYSGEIFRLESDLLDLSAIDSGIFSITRDGKKIRCFTPGAAGFLFSIPDRLIRPIPEDSFMNYGRVDSSIPFAGTKHSTLAVNALAAKVLEKSEYCLSTAIDQRSGGALIGSNWNLYLMGKDGACVWKIAVPGEVRAIADAPEAGLCAAALGDGTIRWYRVIDGVEILALAISRDRARWALWTPGGLWDASILGAGLLGKYIDHGLLRAAEVVPVSRTDRDGYSPREIAHILDYSDYAFIHKPSIFILKPLDESTVHDGTIEVNVKIATPCNAPPTKIALMVNGNPQNTDVRGLAIASDKEMVLKNYFVQLDMGENTLTALAYNRWGCSDTARIVVYRQGISVARRPCGTSNRLFVLSIGVSLYGGGIAPLAYAAKDAQDFAKIWSDQAPCPYHEVLPTVLADKNAVKSAILDSLYALCARASSRDMVMLFMAGHALRDFRGHFCYVPFNPDSGKDSSLITDRELLRPMEQSRARTLCFIDACYAGNISIDYARTETRTENGTALNRTVILHSTAPFQPAHEGSAWNNGVFTKALFEGLRGNADYSGSGVITVTMLSLYVSERVKELTHGIQTPVTTFPNAFKDFPLALVR